MRRLLVLCAFLAAATGVIAGCERTKSANPLSPTIAGPIAGVQISEPEPVSPAGSVRIPATQQPIRLIVKNASTNGVRPLSYVFEVASDGQFNGKIFTQHGVTPGEGRTELLLPQALQADRVYYWRARALDGANSGEYSPAMAFEVFTPVIIGTPSPRSPENGATGITRRATVVIANASVSGPAGAIRYFFEVASDGAMSSQVAAGEVPQGASQTSYTVPADLSPNTRYFWRAKALDPAQEGPWSDIWSFVTTAAAPVPQPGPGGGSGPAPNDALDLSKVIVQSGVSIANWAVTSTVTSVTYGSNGLCINHTKSGQWPHLPFFGDPNVPVEGNQWVFANIGGQWYGGAGEWLRPGQTCKGVPPNMGPDTFYNAPSPLRDWIPRPGEVIGFAVSTPARVGQWGTAERSNVVFFVW